VTGRAGVSSGVEATPPDADGGANAGAPATAQPTSVGSDGKKLLSMGQLRSQIEDAIVRQRDRVETLRGTERRRENQLEETETELKHQREDVQQSGRAVEYYQSLRQRLVSWVGALRQLQSRVIPVQQSFHDIEASVASVEKQRLWEDDMVTVLFENDRLDQVLGRQPDPALFDPVMSEGSMAAVDEFGRDIKSQATMSREQRARERKLIRQQRGLNRQLRGDESDAHMTDEMRESLRERHDALQRALQVAMSELDEEFVSLQNIVDLFSEWKREFPEDYEQCYASHSLADLASVLVQAEMCALNDPWNESEGYNEGKWIAVVRESQRSADSPLDDDAVDRILEKAVYPSICDLLSRNGYDLVSVRQTWSISSFVKHLGKIAPRSSVVAKLKTRLVEYVEKSLQDIAIPIVRGGGDWNNDPAQPKRDGAEEELEDVLHGATVGQMFRLKKIIMNLLVHWGPILGPDGAGGGPPSSPSSSSFIEILLDFISDKFLFLLSSLQKHEMLSLPRNLLLSESPANAFGDVHRAVEQVGWLDDPRWMLQAAPIRAAASAYATSATEIA